MSLRPARSASPRLLMCTDTWPPQVNGVSVVTAETVEGLSRRGWSCEVVAPRYPASLTEGAPHLAPAPVPAVQVPSVPCPGYPDLRLSLPAAPAIARMMERFRPDVVHCATEFTVGWTAMRDALRRSLPLTTSYHTDFARYTEAYRIPWLRQLVSRHIAHFHRRASFTLTPSDAARRDLAKIGVGRVVTWGRAIDVDRFHRRERSDSLRNAYAPPGACIFLHVGRLAPEKGVERIVEAYHIARRRVAGGEMHLVIAGSGPSDANVRALGTEGITFLATLDRHEVLPRLYASADAFVFSSLTETLGLVILEAMASGLPVIATPAGGVAEHLVDGVNGLEYPASDVHAMADRMVRLVRDPWLRHTLGVGARATATRLSWGAELDRLDALYRELLEQPTAAITPASLRGLPGGAPASE